MNFLKLQLLKITLAAIFYNAPRAQVLRVLCYSIAMSASGPARDYIFEIFGRFLFFLMLEILIAKFRSYQISITTSNNTKKEIYQLFRIYISDYATWS